MATRDQGKVRSVGQEAPSRKQRCPPQCGCTGAVERIKRELAALDAESAEVDGGAGGAGGGGGADGGGYGGVVAPGIDAEQLKAAQVPY